LERAAREAQELVDLEAQLAKETPEQTAKRLRKEQKDRERQERSNARYWDAQDRRADREAARRDHTAYASGSRTAEKIGLDSQIHTSTKKELR
jgi:hypothetical protein